MKKIEIQGKRNQDKMKQMDDPNATIERKIQPKRAKVIPIEFYTSDQSLVLDILKRYVVDLSSGTGGMKYADDVTKSPPSNPVLSMILREIDNKRKAYIYQDKQHNIYDSRYSVGTNRVVELLVHTEFVCHYCREICQVMYKESKCRRQWTLDRIDNNYGHND
ncbi:MAG: hypothetical protein EBU66_20700, partial [Bacteroidetes bacterium]|nr:hypothetical protein [Bacteroidota bacterium]